ncbi:MAG: hypothetical protein ACOVNU_04190 [Candidatus Kapaibacteriota bacterium]
MFEFGVPENIFVKGYQQYEETLYYYKKIKRKKKGWCSLCNETINVGEIVLSVCFKTDEEVHSNEENEAIDRFIFTRFVGLIHEICKNEYFELQKKQ